MKFYNNIFCPPGEHKKLLKFHANDTDFADFQPRIARISQIK